MMTTTVDNSAPTRRRLPRRLLVVCLLAILAVASCNDKDDAQVNVTEGLGMCTCLEVHWPKEPLSLLFSISDLQSSLFTAEERQYVRSLDISRIEDRDRIDALALAESIPRAVEGARLLGREPIRVVCLDGQRPLFSFTVNGNVMLVAETDMAFEYPGGSLRRILFPEVHALELRYMCAINLMAIHTADFAGPSSQGYPSPDVWCDVVTQAMREDYYPVEVAGKMTQRRTYPEEVVVDLFVCPASALEVSKDQDHARPAERESDEEAHSVRLSHYAMNPNCRPGSPGDTVLLFEAEAGWNQHGGPELFAFDNHDPKGGCVLLNDGTVKFIRTKAELARLRWEP